MIRCRTARSAGVGSRSTRWPTWRTCIAGIDVGAITTSMTINSPAAVILAMYVAQAELAGIGRARSGRHAPERHLEGVPGAEGVRVPAASVDASGPRCDRVHGGGDAEVAFDLDLGLPHPRGGLDGGARAGVHVGERVRVCGAGVAGGVGGGCVRATVVVLLQRAHRLLRGDREVSGGAAHLGALVA